MSLKNRILLPVLATFAVVVAGTLTFVYPRHNGLGVDLDTSARAQDVRRREPYDLRRVRVFGAVVERIRHNYVDPTRIDYKRMLLAGLGAVQSRVAPVIVRYENGAATLTVQVATASHDFRVSDVGSSTTLTSRMGEILGFVQENLGQEDGIEPRDIEYTAINGVLRTLDPHSSLMTPEAYSDMQTSQRGQFGGLGIVISIRDGNLTVIRPMAGTPASRAGLLRGDRIVRINDESTLNMPLTEAVSRLRGDPGEPLEIWITRRDAGGTWAEARKVQLVRAVIHLQSVEHRMLAERVGYVKINDFQSGNTAEDVRRAVTEMHGQDMRGLVLDLRGNPGGYLDQAIEVSDLFLSRGAIVATRSRVGSGAREREVRNATEAGTEPNYPMVVLINGGSASASEIVAGALKNQGRALIVGQRSFGKGSVQQLYPFADGSALKLTIAQYLTPGDVSIQGVGIVPDVAIDPMTVGPDDLDIEVDQDTTHEADLRASLTSEAVVEGERPSVVMRYYLPVDVRRRLLEATPEENEENEREQEFVTRFGQRLVAHARRPGRQPMLDDARPVLDQIRDEEMAKAVAELSRLGVDWSLGTDAGASTVTVEATTDAPDNTVVAGGNLRLRVRVTNSGPNTLYQLRAHTKSDNGLFDDREFAFGKLAPGESREWITSLELCSTENDARVCRVPRWLTDRSDAIRIEFEEAHGHAPPEAIVRTTIRSLARPQFSYAIQVADDQVGNGDGRIQIGERGSVYVRLRNVGTGRTYKAEANLRNGSGRGVLLRDGRLALEELAPGGERVIRFGFEVLPGFTGQSIKLTVSVNDSDLREGLTEEVVVPVVAATAAPRVRRGVVRVGNDVAFRSAPDASSPIVARSSAATVLVAQADLAGFLRVDLGGGQPGWVATAATSRASGAATPLLTFTASERPPRVMLADATQLVTREPTIRISGRGTDDAHVRDAYVFAGTTKVYYLASPAGGNARELPIDTQVPLHPGMNFVTVVVRESATSITQQTLVVRRDGADGEILETPRFDSDWFAMGAGEDE